MLLIELTRKLMIETSCLLKASDCSSTTSETRETPEDDKRQMSSLTIDSRRFGPSEFQASRTAGKTAGPCPTASGCVFMHFLSTSSALLSIHATLHRVDILRGIKLCSNNETNTLTEFLLEPFSSERIGISLWARRVIWSTLDALPIVSSCNTEENPKNDINLTIFDLLRRGGVARAFSRNVPGSRQALPHSSESANFSIEFSNFSTIVAATSFTSPKQLFSRSLHMFDSAMK
mmetsp:Transcript_20846/g.30985  ORF Transcript_20846/g.30985 Transcript_20846/m.30985 type:complete len:233 (-) Transcript_20846:1963-2661(-)